MARKTLLIGWDSASWNYLDPLLEQGDLPRLQELVDTGCHGVLYSTMPPATPGAWSSIITGKYPQKHGIYDWVWESANILRFATSSDYMGTPFWERLNAQGIRVGLVNIPMTFPAKPVDGFLVCGFGAPQPPAVLTYPAHLLAEIEAWFGSYMPTVSWEYAHHLRKDQGQAALYKEETRVQELHVQIALHLHARYPVDVLAINLMLFDHMNHRASDLEMVHASLRRMDCHLGLLLDGFQPDDVVLLSDHGARRVKGLFLLADWLQDQGYLTRRHKRKQTSSELNYLLLQYLRQGWGLSGLGERSVRALLRNAVPLLPQVISDVFWQSVQARAPRSYDHYWFEENIDPEASLVLNPRNIGTIYMNRACESLWRSLKPEDVSRALARDLESLQIPGTGQSLFQRVLQTADLVAPKASDRSPDLILDFYSSGFSLLTNKGVGLSEREPYLALLQDNPEADIWHGDHQPKGVYLFSGSSFHSHGRSRQANLVDIPATLLHHYGVPVPVDYDGEVLVHNLVEEAPILEQEGDGVVRIGSRGPVMSDVEAGQVLSRLRALGYIG
jgi:predicted AlkP superfamily phosphohydrolase/phosphomutase